MTDRLLEERRVTVLSNATVVHSNPWLGSWLEASRAAGVNVQDLSLSAVLQRGDTAPGGAHLQWPERMLNPDSSLVAGRLVARLLVLCALLRLRGKRVLITAHNVTSHDRRHPVLERALWFALDRLVTDVHALAAAGRDEVVAAHPVLARCRWHVIPLGDYLVQTSGAPTREAARQQLDLPVSAKVVSSFGVMRRYKGVGDLLEAFARWTDRDGRLVVAGRAVDADDAQALHVAADRDRRVQLTTDYVDEDELLHLVSAAELVVLPYRAVLNSSSAFYALSAQRPVLVPSTPTFAELSERVGQGWVRTYDGDLEVEDLMRAVELPEPNQPPDLSWCSWRQISEGIAGMWGVQ